MDTIEIKLKLLEKHKLNINEYLTIIKIKLLSKEEDLPFISNKSDLEGLIDKGFIDNTVGELTLSDKAIKLFFNETINFEELYMLYPSNTPNGRVLRSKSKESLGKLTRDYEETMKRYLKKVRTVDDHNKIVLATKAMIIDHKNRHALDYMLRLETYINKNEWEKYINNNITEYKQNIERL